MSEHPFTLAAHKHFVTASRKLNLGDYFDGSRDSVTPLQQLSWDYHWAKNRTNPWIVDLIVNDEELVYSFKSETK